jgi:Domain of unknown function (DUF4868)
VTPRETLEELTAFVAARPELEVATVARPPRTDGQQEGRVLNLARDAESFFRDVIESAAIGRLQGSQLQRLDPVYKPEPDVIEWVEVAQVPAVRAARERYTNLSPLNPFAPEDDAYKRRLLFWVGVLTDAQGRRAHFFRSFSASAELKRKRGAALVSKEGTFTKIGEQIFLFDDSIDCFVFGKFLFILRKNDYRRIFDQLEEVRRQALKAAAQLNAKVPIANFEAFAKACSAQAGMADKLLAVQKRDYFERLSFQMLEPVIDEFSLGIPVEMRSGSPHLVFKGEPEHRWRILRLVDDDYLRSSMTDHKYEVNSKTESPSP